jgi:hypothetical protein
MVVVLCISGQSVPNSTDSLFAVFTRVALGSTSYKVTDRLAKALRSTAASAILPLTAIHLSYGCGGCFIFLLTRARFLWSWEAIFWPRYSGAHFYLSNLGREGTFYVTFCERNIRLAIVGKIALRRGTMKHPRWFISRFLDERGTLLSPNFCNFFF